MQFLANHAIHMFMLREPYGPCMGLYWPAAYFCNTPRSSQY